MTETTNIAEAVKPAYTITVSTTITPQRIADMMCGACEHNDMTTAWCNGVFLVGPFRDQKETWRTAEGYPWYCNEKLYEHPDFQIEVLEVIDESGDWNDEANIRRHLCGRAEFEAGLQLMAEKYPSHFQDLMTENDDNITHDVFLQCIALKDVVYG